MILTFGLVALTSNSVSLIWSESGDCTFGFNLDFKNRWF